MNEIDWLYALPTPDKWLLDRTFKLFKKAGLPLDSLKIVHVTGTNGKGSVCAMVERGLREAGFKTGLYLSPHVLDFRERIQVNGERISEKDLKSLVAWIKPFVAEMKRENDCPSFFEVVTAIAVKHFLNQHVDWAVVEVGLGGRLDATNVLQTDCSVITNVSLEHTTHLGGTVEEIAVEKAGVIKPLHLVFTSAQGKALGVIEKRAKELKASLAKPGKPTEIKCTETSTSFNYAGKPFATSLLGPHQAENASLAIEVLRFIKVADNVIDKGLRQAFIPARLQIVSRDPLVVIDGAHNPNAVEMLVKAVKTIWPGKRVLLVFGVLADKDYKTMANEIKKLPLAFVNATQTTNDRTLKAKETAKLFAGLDVRAFAQPKDALDDAIEKAKAFAGKEEAGNKGEEKERKAAKEDVIVLCCGSLYLAGDLFNGV